MLIRVQLISFVMMMMMTTMMIFLKKIGSFEIYADWNGNINTRDDIFLNWTRDGGEKGATNPQVWEDQNSDSAINQRVSYAMLSSHRSLYATLSCAKNIRRLVVQKIYDD
jgi:hypothetical protein